MLLALDWVQLPTESTARLSGELVNWEVPNKNVFDHNT